MTTVTNITELNAAFVSAAGLTTGTFNITLDFSGVEHLTMTSSDGSLSDADILDLSVVQHPPMAADFWLV